MDTEECLRVAEDKRQEVVAMQQTLLVTSTCLNKKENWKRLKLQVVLLKLFLRKAAAVLIASHKLLLV